MREQHPTYEDGADIRERAFEFACQVVRFCQRLYDAGGVGRLMVAQILSCSTSVSAMLHEARAAESRRDFVSKCSIALKEANESWVRLRVCEACGIGPANEATALSREADAIARIVGSIIRNTKRNAAGGDRHTFRISNSTF